MSAGQQCKCITVTGSREDAYQAEARLHRIAVRRPVDIARIPYVPALSQLASRRFQHRGVRPIELVANEDRDVIVDLRLQCVSAAISLDLVVYRQELEGQRHKAMMRCALSWQCPFVGSRRP